MTGPRLPKGPAEAIDRGRPITFTVDRRRIEAFEGDTVGSAMAAAGMSIIGRSFKYHRPRGLFCMAGTCPNCLVTVDGVPNVRACLEPARAGMKVCRQNAWPSADADLMGILDSLSFLMPPGFYYKIFHRPRFVWPLVEPLVRRVAGLGKLPSREDDRPVEKVSLHPDVLVVGGGPAGLAAGAQAARAGARTLLLEQGREPGGHLLAMVDPATSSDGQETFPGFALAARLIKEALEAGTEILSATTAFGVFEGGVVAAFDAAHLYRISPKQTIFATGGLEQPAVFPNNDLPGVMLSGAVDRLLHRFSVRPGSRAVIWAFGPEAYRTASALTGARTEVVVLDARTDPDPRSEESAGAVIAAGGLVLRGATVTRADGRRRVRRVAYRLSDGEAGTLECDLLVIGGLISPATGLLAQAGVTFTYDQTAEAWLPSHLPEGVHAAGHVLGTRTNPSIEAQGRLAGRRAAIALGLGPLANKAVSRSQPHAAIPQAAVDPVIMPPPLSEEKGKQFACLCMDVTAKEIVTSMKEGFDSLELLKRYTTLSMGPCQGKSCLTSSSRLHATISGAPVAETGFTTARPPWNPVPLGILAGDRLVPRKESSIHDRHADAGARFMWAGDWIRPHSYGDPEDECRAVHEGVGVIDISTLGKLRVKGPDAVELLERLYPNRFADLRVGRLRYAVMLNDQGVILDDGTVCRLAQDEFFVTVTTGGTEAMDRWITWWLAAWKLRVQVLNVTAAYAAINLAGPMSRAAMERLTAMDVSAESLPYLSATRGEMAGIPCLILRLGFVGELGYEVHFPSEYGEYVWDRVLEEGQEFGIVPFGLEAQRILRLEKQHILVGQDTDALSDPVGSGMPWIVKMDKHDFLGRRALEDVLEKGPEERLVGLVVEGDEAPPEGSAIVDAGRLIGRLTSSRWSNAVDAVVAMGWVPVSSAEDGSVVTIGYDGRSVKATVVTAPFYDPQGGRLRS